MPTQQPKPTSFFSWRITSPTSPNLSKQNKLPFPFPFPFLKVLFSPKSRVVGRECGGVFFKTSFQLALYILFLRILPNCITFLRRQRSFLLACAVCFIEFYRYPGNGDELKISSVLTFNHQSTTP